VKETNHLLTLAIAGNNAEIINIHDAPANENGGWKAVCTVDGTHLSTCGYERGAQVLSPALRPLLYPTKP
jgi:hypothetical protein